VKAPHLYVHVPFCSRRCAYCDFSIAVRRSVPVADYVNALSQELDCAVEGQERSILRTLYFGGGTPSRLGPDGVAQMIAVIRTRFDLEVDAEVTLEANPEDVTREAVSAWREAGVNRLSIGVQSFDDSILEWMHRTHSSADASRAVDAARGAGISNISIDLIFALPENLNRSWQSDLERALGLEPEHISLYGLTVEKGTPLGRWEASGKVKAAPEDGYAEQFLLAHEMMGDAGFDHYEVSNFARPRSRSRHNSAYWTGASYLGAGPSAHSFDGECRHWNVAPYADWQMRLSAGKSVIEESEKLTDANRRAENVYLGLRTTAGYRASAHDLEIAENWVKPGWASIENETVRLTAEGWLRLDSLAAGLTGV
jgi:putative oxygen-independent coproporphyrinogen III oxidase